MLVLEVLQGGGWLKSGEGRGSGLKDTGGGGASHVGSLPGGEFHECSWVWLQIMYVSMIKHISCMYL